VIRIGMISMARNVYGLERNDNDNYNDDDDDDNNNNNVKRDFMSLNL
jgi:hypothetical protein